MKDFFRAPPPSAPAVSFSMRVRGNFADVDAGRLFCWVKVPASGIGCECAENLRRARISRSGVSIEQHLLSKACAGFAGVKLRLSRRTGQISQCPPRGF